MKKFIIYTLLACSAVAFSQEKEKEKKADKYLPKGNKEFATEKYASAEANYRISESNEPAKAEASYNLGNAIYRQKQSGEAAYAYKRAIENAKDKKQKHRAYHNLGNALMDMKDYQTAVEAYKNALRNDPYDDETRYNYALAKEMLKNNPPPEPPKDDDKKDDQKDKDKNKDKNQNQDDKSQGDKGDNQDKGDKGDDKDDKQGDTKDPNKEKDQKDKGGQGNQQEKPADMSPSKQRMENLLDAMENEERKVQDKIQGQKVKVQPKKNEKDW